jgi:hypothetical protein
MNRTISASIAIAMLAATAAVAQQGGSNVNAYTPAQRAAAEAAVKAAGMTPGAISYAQAGSIFINATRGNEKLLVTVTSDGKVHAPSGSTAPMPTPVPPPGGYPSGRGGRGGFGGGGE